jgi:hypothetical protein
MQEWHSARDTVIRDKAKITVYKEPGKDRHSGRGVRCNRNATAPQGTDT